MRAEHNTTVPEIDLRDPEVLRDPFGAYGRVRERSPLARFEIPGIGPVWVVTRYDDARAVLGDPRFEIRSESFTPPPGIPDDCRPYLRTMSEMDGREHMRLRRLVAPAFSPRRAAAFRPQIAQIVHRELDRVVAVAQSSEGSVDLLTHFARPLPTEVICAWVGVPEEHRPRWREHGSVVAAGVGEAFAEAVPVILAGAKAVVAARRAQPTDDLVSDLVRVQSDDGDRLSDVELVTLVWHLLLAGQTPTNLVANAVWALLSHPDQRALLQADPTLMPGAVEELLRWCGPQLLTVPRYAREDVELHGVTIRRGEPITVSICSANRDPRAFPDPDRLDVTRDTGTPHLAFAHGPHFCLGAGLARVEAQVALSVLLTRFPDLAVAPDAEVSHLPDPGTWRLGALPVVLGHEARVTGIA